MSDEKYKATCGVSFTKQATPSFFDVGLVYSELDYNDMLEMERVGAEFMKEHGQKVLDAYQPLVEALIGIGVEKAKAKTPRAPGR